MLVATHPVLAEQTLLEGVAKQVVKDTVKEAVPVEVKKAAETVKTDKAATENLKAKVEHTPKAIKSKVKQKTTEKALKPIR